MLVSLRGRLHHGTMFSAALKAAVPSRYKQAGRRAFLRVASVTNVGSTVGCPCCEKSFRKFARFHGENVQCPSCGSLMRHRAMLMYLRDILSIPEGGRILEVAPEVAFQRWIAAQRGRDYVSLDLDSPLADIHADITELPLEDDSFDLILCLHVLEHVPDDQRAMRELFRVLRPGGRAVIQVPIWPVPSTFEDPTATTPTERERLFGQYDHVRICGPDYHLRLEAAGFEVEEVDPVERLDARTRAEFGLITGEPFYVCVKPLLH
jgi:SAM-dependent methyltransferase